MNVREPILPDRPTPTVRDRARTVGDATVAAVPVVGGPALVLIEGVLRPSYQKRLDAWMERLGEVVKELQQRVGGLDEANLAQNDVFVTAVTQATQIALGTGLNAKLDMLKAALLSVATGSMSDDFLATRYLRFVEELAPRHVTLLSYATDPPAWHPTWRSTDAATPRSLIDSAGLSLEPGLVDLLLADLAARSLVTLDDLGTVARGQMALRPFSTELGAEFVSFIRAT